MKKLVVTLALISMSCSSTPKLSEEQIQAQNFTKVLSQIENSGELPAGVEVYYINGLKIVKTDPHPINSERCYYKHVRDEDDNYKFTSMSCFPAVGQRLSGVEQ